MSEAEQSFLFEDSASILWLAGESRLDFLQRMSTARLDDLRPGSGRATVITSDKGRAVDLVSCHAGDAGAALITSSPAAASQVAEHLRSYVMYRDAVRVTDASDQVAVLRILGPDAAEIAAEVLGLKSPPVSAGDWVILDEGAKERWLLRHVDPGGLEGVDIVAPRGQEYAVLRERLLSAGLRSGDSAEALRARILAGLPAHGAEIDGSTNPLELGLLGLVDFDKGCYIGQEVIARLANYEKVQQRLVRLESADPLSPGQPVVPAENPSASQAAPKWKRPGRITSAARMSNDGTWIALALVPLGAAETMAVRVGETGVARLLGPAG